MTWSDKIEVHTLGGRSLGRFTYDQYEREFGYEVVGHALPSTPGKKKVNNSSKKASLSKKSVPTSKTEKHAKQQSVNPEKDATEQQAGTNQNAVVEPIHHYDTRPWSTGELERLEIIIDELGAEAAFLNFKKMTNRDPDDIKKRIAMLGCPTSNTKHVSKRRGRRSKASNESGPWTKDEDELLEVFASEMTPEEVYALFPKRKSFDVDARLRELHLNTLPSNQVQKDAPAPKAAATPMSKPKVKGSDHKPAMSTPTKWTMRESLLLKERYLEYIDRPERLCELFPQRTLGQIDREAFYRGIIDELPHRPARDMIYTSLPSSSPTPQPTLSSSKVPRVLVSRTGARKYEDYPLPPSKARKPAKRSTKQKDQSGSGDRPWSKLENAIIKRNYPKYGADQNKWDARITGRKKKAIEQQATVLGLKDENSTSSKKKRIPNEERIPKQTVPTHTWTAEEDAIIREHFPKQGYEWPGWKDKLPGITRDEIRRRSEELAPASENALTALAAKFNKGR